MTTVGKVFVFLFVNSFVFSPVEGAKILGLFPLASKSHWNVFRPLLVELASRGHEITSVSLIKPNLQVPNIKEIHLSEMEIFLAADQMENMFVESSDFVLSRLLSLRNDLKEMCNVTLTSSAIKELIKQGNVYDLALVTAYCNECAVQLAPLLAKYVILITPSPLSTMLTFPHTIYPAFIPDRFFSFPPKMNFFERLQNAVGMFLGSKIFELAQNDANNMVLEAVPNALTMTEAQEKISLILINSDPVLDLPQPITPRIISIGGIHLSEAKPLTQNYKQVVENAGDDGFIVFTLGSFVPSEKMPKHIQEALISAFSRLKVKVIWKYNGTIDNLPSNVFLSPWLPQKDLLGHPKCRLFITHGGLLGLQEAIFFGVPVVVIPLYGDHFGNLALLKSYGVGESLGEVFKLTSDSIYETLSKVLETKSYATNMKKYSTIIRDVNQPAVKRGAFWVEYVLRHNGARHLRSRGEDLGFIQYFLLDIIACILLVIIAVFYMLFLAVKCLFCSRKSKSAESLKKKKKY